MGCVDASYDDPLRGEGVFGNAFPGVSLCSTPRLFTLSPSGFGEGASVIFCSGCWGGEFRCPVGAAGGGGGGGEVGR